MTKNKKVKVYGRKNYKRKMILVHRLIMHLMHDFDLNSPLLVLHKNNICKSTSCFDDTHLYIGDYSDNMQDLIKAGKHELVNRTHCSICGMELIGNNLILIGRDRRRQCRNCNKRRSREYMQKKRAEIKQRKKNKKIIL